MAIKLLVHKEHMNLDMPLFNSVQPIHLSPWQEPGPSCLRINWPTLILLSKCRISYWHVWAKVGRLKSNYGCKWRYRLGKGNCTQYWKTISALWWDSFKIKCLKITASKDPSKYCIHYWKDQLMNILLCFYKWKEMVASSGFRFI